MASEAEEPIGPKPISFNSLVVDVSCHPSKEIVASGDIDGEIYVHSYSCTEENHQLLSLSHHKKACRAVKFSPDGKFLYTASKDKSVVAVDLETGAVAHKIDKAHESPLYSMLVIDENLLATGDDDGTFKVWDIRREQPLFSMKENDEFISDMVIDKAKKYLIATSGDGTVTAFNIKRRRMELQSELFDSEFLSLAIVKGGEKVVCGNGEGVLYIFNWGEWGNMSDRFPGHPESVDCIVPINDDIICTGSMDGKIRAVHMLPNRFLGVVGDHDEFPVENLCKTYDEKYLVSCSHDEKVKFWNIEDLGEETVDTSRKATKRDKKKNLKKNADDFFSGLADEEVESGE